MISPSDVDTLQSTFHELRDKLNDAFFAATTTEAKDAIEGPLDTIDDVLDNLDKADLESDNAAIQSLSKALSDSTKQLQDLQKQLDKIVHSEAIVADVIGGIDKALSVAKVVMPLL
jgi:chaperonin cofactor prefoldin